MTSLVQRDIRPAESVHVAVNKRRQWHPHDQTYDLRVQATASGSSFNIAISVPVGTICPRAT
jgi:hypothetical protein